MLERGHHVIHILAACLQGLLHTKSTSVRRMSGTAPGKHVACRVDIWCAGRGAAGAALAESQMTCTAAWLLGGSAALDHACRRRLEVDGGTSVASPTSVQEFMTR